MRFEELKVGDKFIFDYGIEDNLGFGRILFMKIETVKDKYYSYNAIMLTGMYKGKVSAVGKYDEIIPIE